MANNDSIPVTGSQGYTPTADSVQRVSDYLRSVPVKIKPSAVILIDPQQFASIATKMTGGAPTRTAFTIGDRIYLNGATLHSDNTNGIQKDLGRDGQKSRLAELALSHELAHMQDTRPRPWQEAHDSIYNAEGQKIFQQWQQAVNAQQKRAAQAYQQMREQSMVKVPQELQNDLPASSIQTKSALVNQWSSKAGRAYQAEQSRITSDGGRIQPSPTQVQSALNSPLVIGHEGSSQPQPTPTASIGPRMQ